mgnify:CR=1 FL=1
MQSVHNRGLLVISVSHLRSCVGAGIHTAYANILEHTCTKFSTKFSTLLVLSKWTVNIRFGRFEKDNR